MTHGIKIVLALAFLLLAFGLSRPAYADPIRITGEVTYRERMALPPGARLVVRLVDATKPDQPTRISAEAPITGPGGVPLLFDLNFDDSAIREKSSYALVAEIRTGDTLWFRNGVPYPIDPLDIAAQINILVNFIGQPVIPPDPIEALYDVVWQLKEMNGEPLPEQAEITLSLAEDGRSGGRGGCNNYFAQSRVENDLLDFSAVASTRMACAPEIMELETRFFAAVEDVASYVLAAGQLTLNNKDGATLLRFSRAAEAAS